MNTLIFQNIRAVLSSLLGAGFFIVCGIYTNPVHASPDAGQRVYIVKPDAPVTISKISKNQIEDKSEQATVLKDPSFLYKKKKLNKTKKIRVVKPKPVFKKSELVFEKLPVQGHVRQPRVTFKNKRLPITSVDQRVEADFINKVYEPLDDPNF